MHSQTMLHMPARGPNTPLPTHAVTHPVPVLVKHACGWSFQLAVCTLENDTVVLTVTRPPYDTARQWR